MDRHQPNTADITTNATEAGVFKKIGNVLRRPEGKAIEAALVMGIGLSALTACAPEETPKPTTTQSQEAEPTPEPLTCEEFAASLEIPTVDSEAGQAFINEHSISGDIPSSEVGTKVGDLSIEWVTAGINYLPTDRATQLDCLNKAPDPAALGNLLGLKNISTLYINAFASPEAPQEKRDEIQTVLNNALEGVAYRHLQNLYLKPDSTTNEVSETAQRDYEEHKTSENESDTSSHIYLNIGGRIDYDFGTGGVWRRDTTTNQWHWVSGS